MVLYRCSLAPEFFLTLEATLDGIQFSEEGKKEMVKPGRYLVICCFTNWDEMVTSIQLCPLHSTLLLIVVAQLIKFFSGTFLTFLRLLVLPGQPCQSWWTSATRPSHSSPQMEGQGSGMGATYKSLLMLLRCVQLLASAMERNIHRSVPIVRSCNCI